MSVASPAGSEGGSCMTRVHVTLPALPIRRIAGRALRCSWALRHRGPAVSGVAARGRSHRSRRGVRRACPRPSARAPSRWSRPSCPAGLVSLDARRCGAPCGRILDRCCGRASSLAGRPRDPHRAGGPSRAGRAMRCCRRAAHHRTAGDHRRGCAAAPGRSARQRARRHARLSARL